MTESTSETIEGLRIWTPYDSFEMSYNIIAFQEGMAQLKLLDVKGRPNDETLYVTGLNQAVYEIVTSKDITEEIALFHTLQQPIMSAIQPDQEVASSNMREEARVRKLHRGMARAALLSAHYADNSLEFSDSTADLVSVFNMLTHPVHPFEELSDNDIRKDQTLFYLFTLAAIRHKTISHAYASEIRAAVAKGTLSPKNRGGTRATKSWDASHGVYFERRIGFEEKKLVHVPKGKRAGSTQGSGPITNRTSKAPPKPQRKKGTNTAAGKRLVSRKETNQRDSPRAITDQERFINAITKRRRQIAFPLRVSAQYEAYIGENGVFNEDRLSRHAEIGQHAIRGYLHMARADGPRGSLPDQMLAFIGGRYPDGEHKTLLAGNYLATKYNQQGRTQKKLEVPGFELEAMPLAFAALRAYVNRHHVKGGEESIMVKEYCELVLAYLTEAYKPERLEAERLRLEAELAQEQSQAAKPVPSPEPAAGAKSSPD